MPLNCALLKLLGRINREEWGSRTRSLRRETKRDTKCLLVQWRVRL